MKELGMFSLFILTGILIFFLRTDKKDRHSSGDRPSIMRRDSSSINHMDDKITYLKSKDSIKRARLDSLNGVKLNIIDSSGSYIIKIIDEYDNN